MGAHVWLFVCMRKSIEYIKYIWKSTKEKGGGGREVGIYLAKCFVKNSSTSVQAK